MDKLTVVDIDTVTAVLGVTERQVRTWVSDYGCPSNKDGRTRTFPWPEVLAWYVDYASSKKAGVTADFATDDADPDDKENLTRANLRKTRAEADLKQLALSKLRGEVITIADAKVRLDRMLGNLRAQLLSMPARISTRIEAEVTPQAREALIKEELTNLCRELATGAIVTATAEEDSEVIEQMSAAGEDISTEVVDTVIIQMLESL